MSFVLKASRHKQIVNKSLIKYSKQPTVTLVK